jgi:hypothetical protein
VAEVVTLKDQLVPLMIAKYLETYSAREEEEEE